MPVVDGIVMGQLGFRWPKNHVMFTTGIYGDWQETLNRVRQEHPMVFPDRDDLIIPQRAIQVRATSSIYCCLTMVDA